MNVQNFRYINVISIRKTKHKFTFAMYKCRQNEKSVRNHRGSNRYTPGSNKNDCGGCLVSFFSPFFAVRGPPSIQVYRRQFAKS